MTKDKTIKCQNIIEENIGLVKSIVKRFRTNDFDYDDLYQAGLIGLWKAAYHFDEKKGFKFSSFAVKYIMGSIKEELRKNHLIKISRQYFRIINQMRQNDKTDIQDIIKQTGCNYDDIIMAYNLMDNVTLIDVDDYFVEPEQKRYRITKLEEVVLDLFYKNNFKQQQIAKRIGISQSTVSRIIKKYRE